MYFNDSNDLPVDPTNKALQLLVLHLLTLKKKIE